MSEEPSLRQDASLLEFGEWIYRVFVLPSTLQVDLAFAPSSNFGPLAPSFRLMFGRAQDTSHVPSPPPANIIGMSWLYALHARSAIARQRWWQAEYMISGIRNQALTLACLRHGLPSAHAKGVDQLPPDIKVRFEGSLVRHPGSDEVARAFRSVVPPLLDEVRYVDAVLAERLEAILQALASIAGS